MKVFKMKESKRSKANEKQIDLSNSTLKFQNKTKLRSKADKEKKALLMKAQLIFMKVQN